MASIPMPRIYFGKKNQRSQMCRIYTDDGRVVKVELDVLRSCLDEPELRKGFLISPANLFYNDGVLWQVLYEKSCLPLALRETLNVKNLEKLIDQIFDDNLQEAKSRQFKQALKDKLMDRITWIVAIPCSVILVGIVGQLINQ